MLRSSPPDRQARWLKRGETRLGPRFGAEGPGEALTSREQPVHLRPLLSWIVVVRPVHLPAGARQSMPVRSAPAENGVMSRPHVAERATMQGHCRGPRGQRRGHHTTSDRARLVEQDAQLDIRHAFPVQHDVRAENLVHVMRPCDIR